MYGSSDSSDGESCFKFYYYISDEKEEEEDSENSDEDSENSSPKQVRNRLEVPPDAAAAAAAADDDSEMYDLSEQEVQGQQEEQEVQGQYEEQEVQGQYEEQEVQGEHEEQEVQEKVQREHEEQEQEEQEQEEQRVEGEGEFVDYFEEEKKPIPSFWFSTEARNWLELPPELISLIFTKVGPIDILLGPQFVCTEWQKLSKQPHFYRSIDLRNRNDLYYTHDGLTRNYDWDKLVTLAVHRSAGQLVEFSVKHIGREAMFSSITEICSPLKCLRLVECGDEYELMVLAKKLPMLEELEILHCYCNKSMIIGFGRYCPQLKSFRLTCTPERFCEKSNGQAFAIARNMPGLHHLDLFGNPLSDTGLIAILDQCLHLKSLDCRRCFRLNFGEDLLKRCTDRNIDVKLPNDCCVGCGFDTSECDRILTMYDFRENFRDDFRDHFY